MRAFVTGAGGFVGRWLTEHLHEQGDDVVGLGSRDLDVTDGDAVTAAVRGARPEAIYHLAGVSYAPDARSDPLRAFRVNVLGTVNVLEAMRHAAPACVALVAGSAEVYGTPRPEDLPLTEDRPLAPRHPYAASKVAQEAAVTGYASAYGVRAIATRSFNHIGPGQRLEFVVPSLAAQVVAGGPIEVGNLDVARDFTDVRDVVRAYRLLVLHGAPGVAYNVCSGRAVTIRRIVDILTELAGTDAPTVVVADRVRENDPPEIYGSPRRLRSATGWRPTIDLRATLASVISWRSTGV